MNFVVASWKAGWKTKVSTYLVTLAIALESTWCHGLLLYKPRDQAGVFAAVR